MSKINRRMDEYGNVLCSLCHEHKPADQFQRKSDAHGSGWSYYCRPCDAIKAREYLVRRNPDRTIPQRIPRFADDGSIRCPSCATFLPPSSYRWHERNGKQRPLSQCRACENAKRKKTPQDQRSLPAVTNETRKPPRVVSVPVSLAPEHPVAVEPSPRPSRRVQPLAGDESRKRAIQTRVCAVCQQRQPITNYPMFGVGRRRMTCQSCLEQSAPPPVVETPKPAPVLLAPRPAKPVVYPKADLTDCIHAARTCWADDGRALAAHIHQQGIAPGLVRGWFGSIAADAEGYITPKFERPGLAALFDELMKAKYGIRDQREAA